MQLVKSSTNAAAEIKFLGRLNC